MQGYPHHYVVSAAARSEGETALTSEGLPELPTAPPPQYGGPGGYWSPETLLVAAAADCFVLSFRAIARASKLTWLDVACRAEGRLDSSEGKVQFVALHLDARLSLPAGGNVERGTRLLEKAEAACLVTNSLKLHPTLATQVDVEG